LHSKRERERKDGLIFQKERGKMFLSPLSHARRRETGEPRKKRRGEYPFSGSGYAFCLVPKSARNKGEQSGHVETEKKKKKKKKFRKKGVLNCRAGEGRWDGAPPFWAARGQNDILGKNGNRSLPIARGFFGVATSHKGEKKMKHWVGK